MEFMRQLFWEDPEALGMLTLCLIAAAWLAFICMVARGDKKGDKE